MAARVPVVNAGSPENQPQLQMCGILVRTSDILENLVDRFNLKFLMRPPAGF